MNVLEFLEHPYPEIYLELPWFVIDFETTNKDYGSARNTENSTVLVAVQDQYAGYSKFCNEYQLQQECQLAETKLLVAHNAKFELQWLRRGGCDLTKVLVWDTMIAEYILHGNIKVPLDLGSVAKRYNLPGKEQYIDMCMNGGVCPSELPRSMVQRRCVYDVSVTKQIFLKQLQAITEQGKLGVMLTRCLLTPVLADIEFNGMTPDPERVIKEYMAVIAQHQECNAQLSALHPGINWNSPKQVSELLYDTLGFKEATDRKGVPIRTEKGARKADADIIGQLKAKTKEQKLLQELVLREAKLGTKLAFLAKLKDCCEDTGNLQANFNQCITKTHRLSSSGTKYKIQFQNMAREYKPLFKARNPEWLVCEQDGAQLEFRVAAFLGQDQQAVQDIREGADVHTFTAETITAAGQATDRQAAKAHTFKPLNIVA